MTRPPARRVYTSGSAHGHHGSFCLLAPGCGARTREFLVFFLPLLVFKRVRKRFFLHVKLVGGRKPQNGLKAQRCMPAERPADVEKVRSTYKHGLPEPHRSSVPTAQMSRFVLKYASDLRPKVACKQIFIFYVVGERLLKNTERAEV